MLRYSPEKENKVKVNTARSRVKCTKKGDVAQMDMNADAVSNLPVKDCIAVIAMH